VIALARLKQRQYVGAAQDRLGRTIVLEHDRWEHIRKHEQLDGHEVAVLRTVEAAERSKEGNRPGSEVLYARLGPARWLAVVVEYHGLAGRVITAYPYNKEPQTAT
jgi:hypothetical protein